MKIKDRLALYFTLTSTLMLLSVLCGVYFVFLKFMEADFFARLTDRTMVTAKLYLEADEISREALEKVRNQYLVKLNGEVIRIYNSKNNASFIGDDQQYWTNQTINKVRKEGRLQFKEGKRQVVGIFYKDNQGDFVILASAVDQSTFYRLEKLRNIMLISFILIFVILLFSARWIARKILRPLDHFIEDVKQIKSNNLDFRIAESRNKDEITLLAKNFNNLMAHLENAFVLQKTFISNASHELRTPITRMMMAAEISLSREREKVDYQKALTEVLEEAEKMNNIISGLVELAQSDIEYGSSQIETVDLIVLLSTLQKEWSAKNEKGKLLLEIADNDQHRFQIKANPTLMMIAINNIIGNAFKFSDQQDVTCRLYADDAQLQLIITDLGPGIPKNTLSDIFKPFYTAAEKETHRGNGMGLYMSYKIIHLFNGRLEVDSQPGKGSTFSILIPF